jgi:hypothetical protein
MDVETRNFLWTALPIMAHNSSSFDPTFSCNKTLQVISNFRSCETPRIRNHTYFGVDFIPRATNTTDQEAFQHIEAGISHLLAL